MSSTLGIQDYRDIVTQIKNREDETGGPVELFFLLSRKLDDEGPITRHHF